MATGARIAPTRLAAVCSTSSFEAVARQIAYRAGFPPGEAKEDWAILRALSERVGAKLPYDNFAQLRAQLFEAHPRLQVIDAIEPAELRPEPTGEMGDAPFASAIRDHFLTNPVARASAVMAELSKLAAARRTPMAAE
jgi:NADH-quinone oxidoreductase subunit G